MTESAKERDRRLAKHRMRIRRAKQGGRTMFDIARNEAIKDLMSLHRQEFEELQRGYVYRLIRKELKK